MRRSIRWSRWSLSACTAFIVALTIPSAVHAQWGPITLESPANGAHVTSSTITVQYRACSYYTQDTKTITVNGTNYSPTTTTNLTVGQSQCDETYRKRYSKSNIPLVPGANSIYVDVCNGSASPTCISATGTVYYDAPAISVTPDGGSASAITDGSGGSYGFTVTNTGPVTGTANFSISCSGNLACGSQPVPVSLGVGASATVTVTYTGSGAGSGAASLSAWYAEYPSTTDGGSVNVTVNPKPVSTVSVSVSPTTIQVGQTTTATVHTYAADGSELTGREITWSANSQLSAPDPFFTYSPASTIVTGQSVGAGVITATSGSIAGSATVNVVPKPVATVTVSLAASSVLLNQTTTATARAYASDGTELTGRAISWGGTKVSHSSSTFSTVATTTVQGTIVGNGTVTATSEGITGSTPITILPPVATVNVTVTASTLTLGQAATATARAYAADMTELTGRSVAWTPNKVTTSSSTYTTIATTNVTGATEGTGGITATVEGVSGSYSIEVVDPATRKAPTVQIAYADNFRDVGRCVASCFEHVMGYSTPAWVSGDQSRALTLVYRSGSAHPIGTVQLDVVDSSGNDADKFKLQLQRQDASFVTFLNVSPELYFANTGTNAVNRLVAAFDAASLPTGSHLYTATITSIWPGYTRSTALPIRVIVLNESQSVFGAGWTLAGWQRITEQVDGALVTDGTGSASFFPIVGQVDNSRSGTWTASGMTLNGSAYKINDTDLLGQAWHTDNAVPGAYLQLNYSSAHTFSRLRIYAATAGYAGSYTVRGSNNGSTWTQVAAGFVPGAAGWNQITFTAASWQFWRVELANIPGPGSWLNEAEFDGQCSPGMPCNYTAPGGDFSTLTRYSDATYQRRYPDGTVAYFRPDGQQSSLVDRFGTVVQSFQYSIETGVLGYVVDAASQSAGIGYATAGSGWKPNSLRSITTPGARTSWFGVDASNHMVALTDPDNIAFGSAVYATDHRLTQFTDRRGGVWNFAYAWQGTLASSQAPFVDTTVSGTGSVRPTTAFAGPGAAQLSAIADGAGTSGTPVPQGLNPRATVTNPRGFASYFTLSRWGAPTQVVPPSPQPASSYEYLPGTGQLSRSVGLAGHDVRYTWSGPNLTRVLDYSMSDTVNAAYEPIYNQVDSLWGNATVKRWFYYNPSLTGKPLISSREGVFNAPLTVYILNAQGRPTQVTDPGGHVTRLYYSASGFRNTDSVVTPGNRTTWYKYDTYGRVASVRGPGNVTRDSSEYDLMNRAVASVDMQNRRTTLRYDSLFLRAVVDPAGQVDSLVRNALGWVTKDIRPAVTPLPLRGVYDINGNVVRSINRQGQAVTFAYDALDRDTLRIAGTDTARFKHVVYASLNAGIAGYVVGQNAEATDTSFFDILGRLKRRTVGLGGSAYTFAYTFNPNGTLGRRDATTTSTWWSSTTKTVEYGYNSVLALQSFTAFGVQTSLGLNDENLTNTITYPNGLINTLSTTSNHESYRQTYSGPGSAAATALGSALKLDGIGRITEWRRSWGDSLKTFGYETGTGALAWRAIYQSAQTSCSDSLITEEGFSCQTVEPVDHVESYTYDNAGNLLNGVTQLETGNRVRGANGISYTYDVDGNLLSNTGSVPRSFTWNALGQLTSVTANGVTTTFGYDAFGRRVRKTANGSVTRYLLEGDNVFMEMNGSGFPLAEYANWPGIDSPHSVQRGGVTYHFAFDPVAGSVRGLIRASDKAVVAKYGYTPFGVLEAGSFDNIPDTNKVRFGAREYDAETGLYYFRARYYDPQLARFVSEDPIGVAGGLNLYAYTENDPINGSDPFGLCRGLDLGFICLKWSKAKQQPMPFQGPPRRANPQTWSSMILVYFNATLAGYGAAWNVSPPPPGGGFGWLLGKAGLVMGGGTWGRSAAAARGAIGATGRIGETALKQLGGESQVFFRTSQGGRYVDQLVGGIANESKVGYQALTSDIRVQIAKDVELMQSGQIQGSAWHFFQSPVTGVGGPSGPLADALRQAGIDIIIH